MNNRCIISKSNFWYNKFGVGGRLPSNCVVNVEDFEPKRGLIKIDDYKLVNDDLFNKLGSTTDSNTSNRLVKYLFIDKHLLDYPEFWAHKKIVPLNLVSIFNLYPSINDINFIDTYWFTGNPSEKQFAPFPDYMYLRVDNGYLIFAMTPNGRVECEFRTFNIKIEYLAFIERSDGIEVVPINSGIYDPKSHLCEINGISYYLSGSNAVIKFPYDDNNFGRLDSIISTIKETIIPSTLKSFKLKSFNFSNRIDDLFN